VIDGVSQLEKSRLVALGRVVSPGIGVAREWPL
jgi:hypothetical protein